MNTQIIDFLVLIGIIIVILPMFIPKLSLQVLASSVVTLFSCFLIYDASVKEKNLDLFLAFCIYLTCTYATAVLFSQWYQHKYYSKKERR